MRPCAKLSRRRQHPEHIQHKQTRSVRFIVVAKNLAEIVTSNVSSGTVSIIEQITPQEGALGLPLGAPGRPGHPPPGAGEHSRKPWVVTDVRAGKGSEGIDVSPDGKEIWVANAPDATVTIIDVTLAWAVRK
jgi:DNA-binding beta-propeller fold protein YncE